jgi:hypothetical protein
MFKDADLVWDHEFPYDVLNEAGVTPDSSFREVRDADDYLTSVHKVPETRQAMSELEEIGKRLFVDFFLYQTLVEPAAGGIIDDKETDHLVDAAN